MAFADRWRTRPGERVYALDGREGGRPCDTRARKRQCGEEWEARQAAIVITVWYNHLGQKPCIRVQRYNIVRPQIRPEMSDSGRRSQRVPALQNLHPRFKSGRRLQSFLMFLGFRTDSGRAIAPSITKNITIQPQTWTLTRFLTCSARPARASKSFLHSKASVERLLAEHRGRYRGVLGSGRQRDRQLCEVPAYHSPAQKGRDSLSLAGSSVRDRRTECAQDRTPAWDKCRGVIEVICADLFLPVQAP